MQFIGSIYRRPAPGQPVVSVAATENNATLRLGDGNLSDPIVQSATLEATNRVRVLQPTVRGLQVTIDPGTGFFRGSFVHPTTRTRTALGGVIFQKQNFGVGFFLGADRAGYTNLEPVP